MERDLTTIQMAGTSMRSNSTSSCQICHLDFLTHMNLI